MDLKELEDIADFPVCLVMKKRTQPLGTTNRTNTGRMTEEQDKDTEVRQLKDYFITGRHPNDVSENDASAWLQRTAQFQMIDNIIYYVEENKLPRLYVPSHIRAFVFDFFHTSPLGGGHFKMDRTFKKAQQKYFWPKMRLNFLHWTKECITCQLRGDPRDHTRAPMHSLPPTTLFTKLSLDLMGPMPITENGNKYVLNVICNFTKFVVSVALPDSRAPTVAKALLNEVYLKYGGCVELLSDNASYFSGEFFETFCQLMSINKTFTTPYWHQGMES
uniref:RNA-directed DNA polymerase n=1 Tax=Ditylenchus dipsaci TaxID=166011 RepID=A0A915DT93_9BILA